MFLIVTVSEVTWGSICLAHAIAKRSWIDCFVFGLLLTAILSGVYGLFSLAEVSAVGLYLAVIVQGVFFIMFWGTVLARAFNLSRSRRNPP